MEDKKLVEAEFKRVFSSFSYPFKTSDQLIRKMSEPQRNKYLRQAKKINENPVTIQELNELCRELYYQLAVENPDGEAKSLLRGALLFAKKYRARMNYLSMSTPEDWEKAIENANEQIDKLLPT